MRICALDTIFAKLSEAFLNSSMSRSFQKPLFDWPYYLDTPGFIRTKDPILTIREATELSDLFGLYQIEDRIEEPRPRNFSVFVPDHISVKANGHPPLIFHTSYTGDEPPTYLRLHGLVTQFHAVIKPTPGSRDFHLDYLFISDSARPYEIPCGWSNGDEDILRRLIEAYGDAIANILADPFAEEADAEPLLSKQLSPILREWELLQRSGGRPRGSAPSP